MKIYPVIIFFSIMALASCMGDEKAESPVVPVREPLQLFVKPPSEGTDTLVVHALSAVFFQPDSIQLEKLQAMMKAGLYESMMHDLFYQARNARLVLKRDWKNVEIVEITKYRRLLFKQSAGKVTLLDLDSINEPGGIFLFNGIDDPLLADMMNIETEAGFYFQKNKK